MAAMTSIEVDLKKAQTLLLKKAVSKHFEPLAQMPLPDVGQLSASEVEEKLNQRRGASCSYLNIEKLIEKLFFGKPEEEALFEQSVFRPYFLGQVDTDS